MDFYYYYYCLVSDSLIFCNRSAPFPWTVSMKDLHIQLRWWLETIWKWDYIEKVKNTTCSGSVAPWSSRIACSTSQDYSTYLASKTTAVSLCFRGNSVKYCLSWWFHAKDRRCFPQKHPKLVLAVCSAVISRKAHFFRERSWTGWW